MLDTGSVEPSQQKKGKCNASAALRKKRHVRVYGYHKRGVSWALRVNKAMPRACRLAESAATVNGLGRCMVGSVSCAKG